MLGILFAFLSACCFAINFILVQLGMRKVKKDDGVLISLVINVVTLGLIYLIMLLSRGNMIAITVKGIIAFILAGLCTAFLGRTFVYMAIRRIGSSRAAALKNSSPLFTIIIAVLFINEYITLWNGIGILFVLTGLGLTGYEQWKNQESNDSKQNMKWLGLTFALIAALCFGTGFAIRKIGLAEISDPFFGSLIGSIVALTAYVCLLIYKGNLVQSVQAQVKYMNKFYLLAGLATSFGSLFFFCSAYFTQVSYTVTIVAIEPVLTLLFAYLFLKKQEEIKGMVMLSTAFIFLGITIMSIAGLK